MISFGNNWFGFVGDYTLGFVRLFGVGIRWKDRTKHHVFWSERSGKRPSFRVGRYSFTLLGQMAQVDMWGMWLMSRWLKNSKADGMILDGEATLKRDTDGNPRFDIKLNMPAAVKSINIEIGDCDER